MLLKINRIFVLNLSVNYSLFEKIIRNIELNFQI